MLDITIIILLHIVYIIYYKMHLILQTTYRYKLLEYVVFFFVFQIKFYISGRRGYCLRFIHIIQVKVIKIKNKISNNFKEKLFLFFVHRACIGMCDNIDYHLKVVFLTSIK